VEYLESTGTQWMDTGINITATDNFTANYVVTLEKKYFRGLIGYSGTNHGYWGITTNGYYELGFYSKIKELLKEIEVNINNVCSIPDKFDYYYMKYLNDVHNYNNNNYEYIYKCIRYAIQMNNLYKINKVISLVKNDQFLKEINDGVIIKNEKLIQLVNQFNINVCEAIEIVYLINKNNEMFISNNSYLKNLKQN
jgi:hypothetical protein